MGHSRLKYLFLDVLRWPALYVLDEALVKVCRQGGGEARRPSWGVGLGPPTCPRGPTHSTAAAVVIGAAVARGDMIGARGGTSLTAVREDEKN